MKATTGHKTKGKTRRFASNQKASQILPALVAVSGACSLFAGTASAIELGDIKINSSLGQPLSASISYALNPNEQLFDFCIFLRPGIATTSAPTVSRPKITLSDTNIILTGSTPILEPILTMRMSVDCPYTAHLTREYTLMMNPAGANARDVAPLVEVSEPAPVTAPVSAPIQSTPASAITEKVVAIPAPKPIQSTPATATSEQVAAKPAPTPPSAAVADDQTRSDPMTAVRPAAQDASDQISMNSRYFVQTGDSLSAIARRIENRPIGVWPAVHAIFAANPQAFVDGDQNQLTAAVWLDIPDLSDSYVASNGAATNDLAAGELYSGIDSTNAPGETDDTVASPVAPETIDFVDEVVIEPLAEAVEEPVIEPLAQAVEEPVIETVEESLLVDEISADEESAATPDPEQTAEFVDDTAVLRPGDIVVNSETTADADTRAIPVVRRGDAATAAGSGIPEWMLIVGGSALALLLAFFAFGRTLKERFASRGVGTEEITDELLDDEATAENRIVDDVDFQFDDNTINSQSIALDADLEAGTGLQDNADLDVAQDFGFSASTTGEVENAMDLELPEEVAAEPEPNPTDIIEPSHRIEEALFAEETIAAEDTQSTTAIKDGTEYDLSMIVDATKQPLGEEELTAKDLMAVRVDESVDETSLVNQTLSSDVDIAILEQDYQDEFTQTQALNDEIARAAEALALRMDDEDSGIVTARTECIGDPAMTASVEARIEAGNDDLTEGSDLNDIDDPTEIASLDDIDDPTEIASLDGLADLEDTGVSPQLTANVQNPANEPTVEMPLTGQEKTVEMANPGNEPTVEMANPGNEPTVEMANPGNEPTVEMANPGNDATIEMQLDRNKTETK